MHKMIRKGAKGFVWLTVIFLFASLTHLLFLLLLCTKSDCGPDTTEALLRLVGILLEGLPR